MNLERNGSKTPNRSSLIISKNKTMPKIPRKSYSPCDSKKVSPRISFRGSQNFAKPTNSMQKYIRPMKKGTKKMRKSLEKHGNSSPKNSWLYKNFMSSTITPTMKPAIMPEKPKLNFMELQNESKNYMFMYQIGFGGFGKVWKVQNRKNYEYYAMKEIQKRKVIAKDSVSCINNQLNLLKKLNHPFIVNIHSAFQDQNKLYMIMDYLKGADLRYHICYKQKFSQIQTKFILACLIQGIEYLHHNKIIHRDIKPENLVLEESGYVRITDFGISKDENQLRASTKYDSSGTPGYIAPEMMEKKSYGFQVDFFALGVIAYELMFGERPYVGKNRKQIKQMIQNHQVRISKEQIPSGWTEEAADFINRLLQRCPAQRLGFSHGARQLKKHRWMQTIDWKKLHKKQMKPPFVPNIICETKQYLQQIYCYNQMNDEQQENNSAPLKCFEQKYFENYDFFPCQERLLGEIRKGKAKKSRKIL